MSGQVLVMSPLFITTATANRTIEASEQQSSQLLYKCVHTQTESANFYSCSSVWYQFFIHSLCIVFFEYNFFFLLKFDATIADNFPNWTEPDDKFIKDQDHNFQMKKKEKTLFGFENEQIFANFRQNKFYHQNIMQITTNVCCVLYIFSM